MIGRRGAAWLLSMGLAIAATAGPAAPAAAVSAAPDSAAAAAASSLPRDESAAVERAWLAPAESLAERVWRTRRTAVAHGIWDLEAAARALLATPSVPVERAEAAVQLAPDLPAARMELAAALWLKGDSPLAAIRHAAAAVGAFQRHPEGLPWLLGSVLTILSTALLGGGLLCILVIALAAAPHAAHDLGDLFARSTPAFGRTALVASALFLPLVLGEGVLGLAAGLLALGAVHGAPRQRRALAVAALAVVVGAYPGLRLAGAVLYALPADPLATAVLAVDQGVALESDVERLAAAPDSDSLALQARARLARRAGNLGTADALYQQLLAQQPQDPVYVNNAANVRLHLGHMESAFELYDRSLELDESPAVLFNLSQAYGRAYQVDDLSVTLERAQKLDGDLAADLTRLQGTQPEGFVVDLPVPNEQLWRRALDLTRGADFAAELRAPLAPGRLGRSAVALAGMLLTALAGGTFVGSRLRPSRFCARCGSRVCPRCHPKISGGELCGACNRLFYQPGKTDRALRLSRVEALRQREARLDRLAVLTSLLVPGAAGLLARRPLRCFVGAFCFVAVGAALAWREGVVPDPLVAGAAGPFAFAIVAALAGIAYGVVVGSSLAARRGM